MVSECPTMEMIVLTYACDRRATLDRLSTYLLSELQRLDIKVSVIVVGCKLDLRDEKQISLEPVMAPIMQQFHIKTLKSDLCGDATSRTPRALSSWLTVMIGTVLLRLGMNYTGCSMRLESK